ncbi:DUF421 domain-containing protein [Priestia filamentosa]|uniref:DUF421 domain-containing protein n=1 Tax=Priestia filamentosa TaxID=1402861 RepID=UPI001FB31D89|nr:DUF421 domain-containing protein [Priestia filamentosa]UOE58982.1 DUF421 domain-containing protein [Priestia filamentosa]
MNFIWQSAILILAGIFLLRIAGRKSISQMTLPQTVVMISLGTIIVQPIVEKSMMKAIGGAAVFTLSIVLLEYVQVKSNAFEKFLTGKSKIVIQNGQLDIKTLKKLRLTVDQLEVRLRNQGITNIQDVKTATIEPNGQLGYELQDDAKPLTVREFKHIMAAYFPELAKLQDSSVQSSTQSMTNSSNIFEEMNQTQEEHSKYLQ